MKRGRRKVRKKKREEATQSLPGRAADSQPYLQEQKGKKEGGKSKRGKRGVPARLAMFVSVRAACERKVKEKSPGRRGEQEVGIRSSPSNNCSSRQRIDEEERKKEFPQGEGGFNVSNHGKKRKLRFRLSWRERRSGNLSCS